jgi:hypothetical protein
MSTTTCPVCGQALLDASAARRVEQNLAKIHRQEHEAAKRQIQALEAKAAKAFREGASAAKEEAKRVLAERLAAEQSRRARAVEEARAQAAEQERKKHDKARDLSGRQIERMQRELNEARSQLEKLSADERGEVREVEVFDVLNREFKPLGDDVTRMNKTKGSGDILHEVRANGGACGTLVYECKNRKQWANEFITQAKESCTLYSASRAIVVSTCFPRGEKYLCSIRGVHVVHPSLLAPFARVIRDGLVKAAASASSPADRERKTEAVFRFVRSEAFTRNMKLIAEAVEDLKELQRKERSAHQNTWAKQTSLLEQIESSKAGIDVKMAEIVEGPALVVLPDAAAD